MLEPLRNRTYRQLFTAQVIALIGTGFLTVALGLLAYELAGGDAGAVLGTALAIKMIAYVGVSPIASAVAGMLPRRAMLVALDLLRAAIALCLPFVNQVWQIYILIFILQSASAAFTPTFQATIPDILPEEKDYTKALSLSRLAYDLETLLSPALAAALLTVMSFPKPVRGNGAGLPAFGGVGADGCPAPAESDANDELCPAAHAWRAHLSRDAASARTARPQSGGGGGRRHRVREHDRHRP